MSVKKLLGKGVFKNSYILLNNTFYLSLSRLFNIGLSFIFWIIIANKTSVTDVGYASVFVSLIVFISSLVNFGLNFWVLKFFPDQTENKILRIKILIGIIYIILTSDFLFIIAFFLFSKFILHSYNFIINDWNILIIFFLSVFLYTMSFIIINIWMRYNFWKLIAIKGFIQGILKIILVLYFLKVNLYLIILIWFFSMFFGILLTNLNIFKIENIKNVLLNFSIKNVNLINNKKFTFNNYFFSQLILIPNLILNPLIFFLLGPDQSGYFYITFGLVQIIQIVPIAFSETYLSKVFKNPLDSHNLLLKSLTFSYSFIFSSLIFMGFFGKLLLSVYGKKYTKNFDLLILLIIWTVPYSTNFLYIQYLRGMSEFKKLFYFCGTKIIVFPVLIGFLSIEYQLIGISLGLIIIELISFLLIFFMHKNFIFHKLKILYSNQ